MGDVAFGRISVAIVTPFVDADIDEEQPIDIDGLSSVISHVSAGLLKVRGQGLFLTGMNL